MKKIILLLLLSSLFVYGFSQEKKETEKRIFKKFKTDVSLGYAIQQGAAQTTGTKGGALFAIEPKYAVLDVLAIGLRMEAAVTANLDQTGNSSSSARANLSYLITGDYYFTNKKFRPFGGVGAGMFTTASVNDKTMINSMKDIPQITKFGFMARTGFEYGHLRMGIEYNFVPDKAGYLGIKLGVCIGGGRK